VSNKIKRTRGKRRALTGSIPENSWIDADLIHYIGAGKAPTPEDYQMMTAEYQQRIRESQPWKQIVRRYGKAKAEEMLKEFQVKPG
jgi:hypothetical protein